MVSKSLLALMLSAISLTGVEARACIKRSSSLSLTDLPSPTSSILSTPTPIVPLSTPAPSDIGPTPSTAASPISETTPSTIPSTTPSTSLSDLPATPIITPSTDASLTTPGITPSTDLPATTPEVASTIASSSTPEVTSSTVVSSTIPSTTLMTSTTSAAPACTPSNLVSNPSFEQGVSPWINFQGAVASSSGAVTAKDGNSYFLAALTGSNNFISVRQSLQMEIGQTYDVKAYYGLGAHQNFGASGSATFSSQWAATYRGL
uniref:CBM-cenC domain-containing protein n=1 Tax=Bionectria ochroleuca TaxID=29856 RepID=A0A8H7NB78_BIOOC